jgi:DNA-binding winged helix-turn-helix (wHTH) protein
VASDIAQLVQKSFRRDQIGGAEPFGKPVTDRRYAECLIPHLGDALTVRASRLDREGVENRGTREEAKVSCKRAVDDDQSALEDAANIRRQGNGSTTMPTTVERLVDYRAMRETIKPASGSTTPSGHLPSAEAPALARCRPDSGFDERPRDHSQGTGQFLFTKRSSEISFGPFRLLPAQFLLLEGDKPVSLGSRAMHILIVLLERPGELVTKQELMARVWPDLFVEPANLPVNIAALRRALRDGRDGNRFIINIRGRGYCFVDQIRVSGHEN